MDQHNLWERSIKETLHLNLEQSKPDIIKGSFLVSRLKQFTGLLIIPAIGLIQKKNCHPTSMTMKMISNDQTRGNPGKKNSHMETSNSI